MKKYLIILGPPGSGKGTQAKKIAEKYGYHYFGTGELMRKEADKGTELGKEFEKVWDQGEGGLVSEELVLKLVKQEYDNLDKSKGIVFDGYPRRIVQAEYLANLLESDDILVLNLEVGRDELIHRLLRRHEAREEDNPEIITKRLDVYDEETKPLLEYYRKKNTVVDIDGNPPIDEVWKSIQEKIEQ